MRSTQTEVSRQMQGSLAMPEVRKRQGLNGLPVIGSLLVMALVIVLVLLQMVPPAVVSRSAPLTVFFAERAMDHLQIIARAPPIQAVDVQKIDAFVNQQMQSHGLPGLALALVENDQVIFMKGYGKADQTGRSVMPQTPFLLASVSKPITAAAIMQLVEAGRVDLAVLLLIALWPLLHLRRWYSRLLALQQAGRLPLARAAARAVVEIVLALVFLVGIRLFIVSGLGAQSWYEVLTAFPDFVVWIWAVALIGMLTGAIRMMLILQAPQQNLETQQPELSSLR